MKRYLIGLILALAMVLAVGAAACASPPVTGDAGDFVLFGEYASDAYMYSTLGYVIGAGYNFGDGLCLGFEAMFLGWELYGGFVNLTVDPLAFNVDVLFNSTGQCFVKAAGLYLIDLDPVTLGLGGGAFYGWGDIDCFLEGTLNIAASDHCSLYGTVDYNLDSEAWTFKVGVAFTF